MEYMSKEVKKATLKALSAIAEYDKSIQSDILETLSKLWDNCPDILYENPEVETKCCHNCVKCWINALEESLNK